MKIPTMRIRYKEGGHEANINVSDFNEDEICFRRDVSYVSFFQFPVEEIPPAAVQFPALLNMFSIIKSRNRRGLRN